MVPNDINFFLDIKKLVEYRKKYYEIRKGFIQ